MHFFELLWPSFTPTNDTNKCLQDASEKLKCHRKCITYHPDPRCADSQGLPKTQHEGGEVVCWGRMGQMMSKMCAKKFHSRNSTNYESTHGNIKTNTCHWDMSKLQHAHHFLLDVHHSLFMESLHHKNKGHSSLLFAPQFPTSCVPAKMAPELQLCLQQFRLLN